jgi:hypothetical protein
VEREASERTAVVVAIVWGSVRANMRTPWIVTLSNNG